MDEKEKIIANTCNFGNLKPAMMDLPYPPIQVKGENQKYADLLSVDYCGSVSEMSAITQYINNQNRLSCEKCTLAKTILSIAVAEMMHLQKLGELIYLLGGNVDYVARYQNGQQRLWTPSYLVLPWNIPKIIQSNIDSEREAVSQYKKHMSMIEDDYVNAVLARIVKDEEYHIMLLNAL